MIKVREKDDPLNAVYESVEYKKTCREEVLRFPLILDIEITSRCNLDCIMCARQIKSPRKMGDMSDELFFKIADQAAGYGARLIRFSGYGEALLHKSFTRYLKYAKKKGLLTHLTTNGHLLNEKICAEIICAPLDKIKFSFQGTDEKEYNRMRNTKSYKNLAANIFMLKKIRRELGGRLPVIQVATTVLDETAKEIKAFYDRWRGVADNIYHLPTVIGRLGETPFGRKERARSGAQVLDSMCMEVRTKMSVWNDGTVSGCCGDHFHQLFLGDIKKKTLMEIWNGAPAKAARRLLREKTPAQFNEEEKKKYPLCAECQAMYIERPS